MTLREFYSKVKCKTEAMKLSDMESITSLSSLCYHLTLVQMKESALEEVQFLKRKKDFFLLFENFEPKKILKNGSYSLQLERVLDAFTPERINPYKKLTKIVLSTASFLSFYSSLDDFILKVLPPSTITDDKVLFSFLNDFRLKYHLPNMFFNTTCYFFSKTGLLDIPYLNDSIKETLKENLEVEEDNYALFHLLYLMMKISDDCGYEVSQRLESY